jgi:hypothetical protein
LDISSVFDVITQSPNLVGALCKGMPGIFELPPTSDPEYTNAVGTAVTICYNCPALLKCQRHLDKMPPEHRPDACVMAGRVLPKLPPAKRRLSDHV